MAKFLRYRGEFLSRAGLIWRIEIHQEADRAFPTIEKLIFEANEALVIDWEAAEKEAPVCGSTATIRLESPGDRSYVDLYTIAPGRIALSVYRNNVLYWKGLLDPEFYEEPYEREAHYPVSLTFSDFGILDRLNYNLTGPQTLRAIIIDALSRAGLYSDNLLVNTSTVIASTGEAIVTLSELTVQSANFYDEDGEPSTLREVMEGILQPLGLKIIQKAGGIHVYDLNALYHKAAHEVVWSGDCSTYSVDKVFNNIKLTFSPYAKTDITSDEVKYGGTHSASLINLTNSPVTIPGESGSEYYSYWPDYENTRGTQESELANFTIFLGKRGRGLKSLYSGARYFTLEPLLGGPTATDGVALSVVTGGHCAIDATPADAAYKPVRRLLTPGVASNTVLMECTSQTIPYIPNTEVRRPYLRMTLEILADVRYNPFSSAGEFNEQGNYEWMINQGNTRSIFVPVALEVRTAGGDTWYYSNIALASGGSAGVRLAFGEWKSGAARFGDCWLQYYKIERMSGGRWEHKEFMGGWITNRHTIGCTDKAIAAAANAPSGQGGVYVGRDFLKLDDGEYIPYPPIGGELSIKVYAGLNIYSLRERTASFNPTSDDDSGWRGAWLPDTPDKWTAEKYSKLRWLLYKAPTVELVDSSTFKSENARSEDIEYSGYINRDAKEDLRLDTVCGTTLDYWARGGYLRTSDSQLLGDLRRAGVTDCAERLLIGTLFAQYAGRHVKLSGEIVLDPATPAPYTEQNQDGRLFLLAGETEDCITDTADAVLIELSPDEYVAIEPVDD